MKDSAVKSSPIDCLTTLSGGICFVLTFVHHSLRLLRPLIAEDLVGVSCLEEGWLAYWESTLRRWRYGRIKRGRWNGCCHDKKSLKIAIKHLDRAKWLYELEWIREKKLLHWFWTVLSRAAAPLSIYFPSSTLPPLPYTSVSISAMGVVETSEWKYCAAWFFVMWLLLVTVLLTD